MPLEDVIKLDEAVELAEELADSARTVIARYFREPIRVEQKADLSPVTQADREVESMMRERINKAYPTHGILGEEHGRERLDHDYVWVLDPIDGTKSFITGNPLFGSMICLLHHWVPQLAVIDVPMLDERWTATAGKGAFLNGAACTTSTCGRLSDALVYTTSIDAFDAESRALFDHVSGRAKLRRFGGDCYSYGLLASGYIDVVFGAALEPYDFLPLCGLVESAGGIMTDWSGKRLQVQDSKARIVACATPALHEEILALLNR